MSSFLLGLSQRPQSAMKKTFASGPHTWSLTKIKQVSSPLGGAKSYKVHLKDVGKISCCEAI